MEHLPDPEERGSSGMRGHLVAVAAGAALVTAMWLLPDLTPPAAFELGEELAHGRVVEVLPSSAGVYAYSVRLLIVDGPRAGETIEASVPAGTAGGQAAQAAPQYDVGDDVVASIFTGPAGGGAIVSDRWRVPVLGALLALFAIAVTIVGGWRGIRSLLALGLTVAAVVKLVIPLVLSGWDPVGLAVATACGVALMTLLLTEGPRRTTLAAVIGTFAALALTAGLAAVFNAVAEFSAFQGSEEAAFLLSLPGPDINLQGLLLAAVIFGALGVLDDVTLTQAAAVEQLSAIAPDARPPWLFWRAMEIGRSHIAATVNTLLLAYLGASLPLLVLIAVARQSPLLIANGELIAVEIVRGLVGSVGIVVAVPLTTAVASVLVRARSPWRATTPGAGARP